MIKNIKLLELFNSKNFDELEKALYQNVVEENNKLAGKKASDTAILNRLYKKSCKQSLKALQKLNKFQYNGIDYFGLSDGHYILASTDIKGYPIIKENEGYNFAKFFNNIGDMNYTLKYNIKELKYFIKQCKVKKRDAFYTKFLENDYMVTFNAELLVDCLEYCETNKIIFCKSNSFLITPVYLEKENKQKIALLLPLYKTPEKENIINAKNFMNEMLEGFEN